MKTLSIARLIRPSRASPFGKSLFLLCASVPIPVMNIVLDRLVKTISKNNPDIFNRLEGHYHKWFMINPTNIPFSLYLRPDPAQPRLRACRKQRIMTRKFGKGNFIKPDASMTGSFLTLLGMIDGRYDGDALFFTRDLCVEGDTEAIVCLRNALDDMDGSIADETADFFGSTGRHILKIARRVSTHVHHP